MCVCVKAQVGVAIAICEIKEEMGKRWRAKERAIIVEHITERDGTKCSYCNLPAPDPPRTHEIDHVDNNKENNKLSNLVFACKSCNVKKQRKFEIDCLRAELLRREGKRPTQPRGFHAKKAIGFENGSVEMRANNLFEGLFRDYVAERMAGGSCDYEDVIAAGAYVAGCSIATARRYLGVLTSSEGPYFRGFDEYGVPTLFVREKL